MIPGSFEGLRFLYAVLTEKVEVSLEERDRAIAEYARRVVVRAGVPNPVPGGGTVTCNERRTSSTPSSLAPSASSA
jgi:hypothetical protein